MPPRVRTFNTQYHVYNPSRAVIQGNHGATSEHWYISDHHLPGPISFFCESTMAHNMLKILGLIIWLRRDSPWVNSAAPDDSEFATLFTLTFDFLPGVEEGWSIGGVPG